MNDQIVTREKMRARGAAAFERRVGRNGHEMNPGAPAIFDWQCGWDEAHAKSHNTETDAEPSCAR